MELLSLIGIFAGLALMIWLTFKGHSIIWVAPLSAFVVVLFAFGAGLGDERTLLSSYTVDYMKGVGEYFISWFPVFLLGAIYGKVMEITGAAKALADVLIKLIGPRFVVLAVLIPCMLLTYGGVSLFVVVFIMYPMGIAIYKAAGIPREMLPAVIAFGSFGFTMTSIPGSPQIQNLIPMDYFGTTAAAAPFLGIVASLAVGIPGYLYLSHRAKKVQVLTGVGFGKGRESLPTESGLAMDKHSVAEMNLANDTSSDNAFEMTGRIPLRGWLSGLVPLIVVFLTLNVFKLDIVVSLIIGIIVCCLFWPDKCKQIPSALTEGAKGSVTAIMNTACAVGFGSVIRIVPGFVLLTGLLISQSSTPLSLLFSEAMSTAVLSGATGSASGGLSIALAAFSDQYLQIASQIGITPELLHRMASIAAGSLDKLPHNGAVVTLLAVCHCTHKESYKDIFVVSVLLPLVVLILLVLIWGCALHL